MRGNLLTWRSRCEGTRKLNERSFRTSSLSWNDLKEEGGKSANMYPVGCLHASRRSLPSKCILQVFRWRPLGTRAGGWSHHPRVPASRGQRNAATAPHTSLPILGLWLLPLLLLLLLLRRVKATHCAGARRRWSPSRMWVLMIRCSRPLLRKTRQWQKWLRRFVAPSP